MNDSPINDSPIIVKQFYSASPKQVWEAITEPLKMCQWYFEPIEKFEARIGFSTEFDVECEGTVYRHCWNVMEVEPEEKIVYRWCYADVPGESMVTWSIAACAKGGEAGKINGSELTLSHEVIEPFPSDDPVFSRENGESGWQYFVNDQLKEFLERIET